MKKISVVGIGVISNLGNDPDTIWDTLSKIDRIPLEDEKIDYKSILPPIKRRRMNRYSDITLYTASKALEDADVTVADIGEYNIGTIYTTGYGPMAYNLKFSKVMVEGDPDMCSPTVFANTVSNACIGNVCIQLGTKGVSTIIMGSDNLAYSQMLISKGDASYILTGSIEEHCEELFQSFHQRERSKDVKVKEGAVTFLVKEQEEKDTKVYAQIIEIIEGSLGNYPLIHTINTKEAAQTISEMAEELKKKYQFDAVFTSCNNTSFDKVEMEALGKVFGEDMVYIHNVKELLGETLGSAFNMNVLIGTLCLKHGELPIQLASERKAVHTILVSGYDVSGNYSLAVLQG